MNTNTNTAEYGRRFRRALLAGMVALVFLLMGSTEAVAQNWVSSTQAQSILRAEATTLDKTALTFRESEPSTYRAMVTNSRLYSAIYEELRTGTNVPTAVEKGYIKVFGAIPAQPQTGPNAANSPLATNGNPGGVSDVEYANYEEYLGTIERIETLLSN